MTTRTYSELSQIDEFFDRFRYLALHGSLGRETFGFDRWMNQQFYASREWKDVRRYVILRDEACDLGDLDRPIRDRLYVHHMNPMTVNDIAQGEEHIFDPEYLITTCHRTHNAIHYGDERLLPQPLVERTPGDTTLWGKGRHHEDQRSRR